MAFSTNALRFAIGDGTLSVWDTETSEQSLRVNIPDDHRFSVAFSYDGSHIACGTIKSTVYVWDSVSGAQVISPLRHSGSSKIVNAVAWSTDGECLLSGGRTGEMNLWNVTSPKGSQPITKIHHPGCSEYDSPLTSVALSWDGSRIASCSKQGGVRVWDSKT
ncbi:WD40 repeat-like protein, partial [Athelia psychrophila]